MQENVKILVINYKRNLILYLDRQGIFPYNDIINRKEMISIMTSATNIARLQKPETVFDLIETFLISKGLDSKNTQSAYRSDIEQFFKIMRNKDIGQLTFDELCFKNYEIEQYKAILAEQYAGSTVNRKIATLKSLYDYFAANDIKVNKNAFKVKRIKHNTASWGALSPEEGFEMVERVKKQRKGAIKSALIHTALETSFRLSALLSAEYSNISETKNEQGLWTMTLIEKGNKEVTMPISDELYEKLQSIRKPKQKKIFNLDPKTCRNALKTVCEEMGISAKRNISFHSLRNVAINFSIDIGQDIMTAARQGNHSSPSTTLNHYLKKKEDLSNMPGLLMGQKIDLSILESLSAEEWMLLVRQLDGVTQRKIIRKAKEKALL